MLTACHDIVLYKGYDTFVEIDRTACSYLCETHACRWIFWPLIKCRGFDLTEVVSDGVELCKCALVCGEASLIMLEYHQVYYSHRVLPNCLHGKGRRSSGWPVMVVVGKLRASGRVLISCFLTVGSCGSCPLCGCLRYVATLVCATQML